MGRELGEGLGVGVMCIYTEMCLCFCDTWCPAGDEAGHCNGIYLMSVPCIVHKCFDVQCKSIFSVHKYVILLLVFFSLSQPEFNCGGR